MRVIAGKYRSRKLFEIKNEFTRPTMDRNREMVFNVLGQYFSSGVALDLFSGTGSMGIEAISRGVDFCYLVDKNSLAIETIKANVKSLKIENCEVFYGDYERFFLEHKNVKFDLVFLDPPYSLDVCETLLAFLDENDFLNDEALVLVEVLKGAHETKYSENYELLKIKPSTIMRFEFYKYRRKNK